MSKHFDAEKMLHTQKYKLILVCIWTAILVLCFLNREHFTVNGVLEYTPENPILAAAFMMFLFALKSLSVFIFSGFLFIANGILFPLPSAIMLNVLGACIMISLPYWVGKQVGKGVIDHIVRKYPKAEALKGIRTNHDFIFSFVTRAINIFAQRYTESIYGRNRNGIQRIFGWQYLGNAPASHHLPNYGDKYNESKITGISYFSRYSSVSKCHFNWFLLFISQEKAGRNCI